MALTITGQRNLYGELTSGTANVSNLDFGQRMINAETRRLVAKLSDHLLHTTANATTVVNQQAYEFPNNLKKIRAINFTIGSNTQWVRRSPSREHWDYLNTATSTAYTSEFAEWYYPIGTQVLYWPTPSTGSATITYDYDKRFADATVADYTTGTITQLTTGSTSVLGSSTAWGSAMAGRFFRADKSNTFNNDGDGEWYEVDEVTNTTQLQLKKTYQGHTTVGGAGTYTIGEVSPLPEGFHELPIYRAAEFYYAKTDQARAQYFREIADEMEEQLLAANDVSDVVVVEDMDVIPDNPNLYPKNLS